MMLIQTPHSSYGRPEILLLREAIQSALAEPPGDSRLMAELTGNAELRMLLRQGKNDVRIEERVYTSAVGIIDQICNRKEEDTKYLKAQEILCACLMISGSQQQAEIVHENVIRPLVRQTSAKPSALSRLLDDHFAHNALDDMQTDMDDIAGEPYTP